MLRGRETKTMSWKMLERGTAGVSNRSDLHTVIWSITSTFFRDFNLQLGTETETAWKLQWHKGHWLRCVSGRKGDWCHLFHLYCTIENKPDNVLHLPQDLRTPPGLLNGDELQSVASAVHQDVCHMKGTHTHTHTPQSLRIWWNERGNMK